MTEEVRLSDHARWRLARRGLDEETILRVAREPEQVIAVQPGREIRQARVALPPEGKTFLVRVVVDAGGGPVVVVTAYRTSRIDNYWRKP
jgi:hypothetical protein